MSFASRTALAVACLVLVAGSRARAQDPVSPPDPSDDALCCQRFHFRMPRMSLRAMRPMRFNHMERMDMGRFRIQPYGVRNLVGYRSLGRFFLGFLRDLLRLTATCHTQHYQGHTASQQ